MAKNVHSEGKIMTLTAPSGGVESGNFYLFGETLVVAQHDAEAGDDFEAATEGVHRACPADDGDDFDELETLYWNDTDGKLFASDDGGTGDGHPKVGVAAEAKTTSATECPIKLTP